MFCFFAINLVGSPRGDGDYICGNVDGDYITFHWGWGDRDLHWWKKNGEIYINW